MEEIEGKGERFELVGEDGASDLEDGEVGRGGEDLEVARDFLLGRERVEQPHDSFLLTRGSARRPHHGAEKERTRSVSFPLAAAPPSHRFASKSPTWSDAFELLASTFRRELSRSDWLSVERVRRALSAVRGPPSERIMAG